MCRRAFTIDFCVFGTFLLLERQTKPFRTTCVLCSYAQVQPCSSQGVDVPVRELRLRCRASNMSPASQRDPVTAPCRPCGYQSGSSFQTTVAGSSTALQKAQAMLRSGAVR